MGDTKEVLVNLFKSADEQDGGKMDNQEFLMHLDAEITDQGNEKVQEAEFIIVVDRSGSMQGTPWKQVQGALCKMLDLTRDQGNIRIRVISYNQEASQVALTGESQVDKASIDKIRASGSTSFVAVFKHLSAIFKDKTEDASKAFFVFFMTDGEDTVSSPKEIMQQKELMQTDIEKFGAEVAFHVLGFSEQHDEQFLESLTFLGTSDGTYSFVSPSEGGGHRGEIDCSSAVHLQCCRTKPQHRDEEQRPPVPGRHLRRGQGGGRGARHGLQEQRRRQDRDQEVCQEDANMQRQPKVGTEDLREVDWSSGCYLCVHYKDRRVCVRRAGARCRSQPGENESCLEHDHRPDQRGGQARAGGRHEGVAQVGPGEVCQDHPGRREHPTEYTEQEEGRGIRNRYLQRDLRGIQGDE